MSEIEPRTSRGTTTPCARSFVVVGTKATASPAFSLVDLAGTSGRLDVLLRCVRSALLLSHGLRRDVTVYLVLLGGAGDGALAPRVLRVRGADVKFLRPDERALATLAQKVLAEAPRPAPGELGRAASLAFTDVRPGVAVASGGIEAAIADVRARAQADGATLACVQLDEGGADLRAHAIDAAHVAFFLGDHFGIDEASLAHIAALAPAKVSIGPVSVHADDAIAVVSNELDRRGAA